MSCGHLESKTRFQSKRHPYKSSVNPFAAEMEKQIPRGDQPRSHSKLVIKPGLKPRSLLMQFRERSGSDAHTAAVFGFHRSTAQQALSLGVGVQTGLPARGCPPAALRVGRAGR